MSRVVVGVLVADDLGLVGVSPGLFLGRAAGQVRQFVDPGQLALQPDLPGGPDAGGIVEGADGEVEEPTALEGELGAAVAAEAAAHDIRAGEQLPLPTR